MDGGEKKEVRRPMNAFLIFCKRHRGFVREKNPDMDNRCVTRVLGDLWANLGEEKKIYTNLAKQYKDAFLKAHPNYKWHCADKSQGTSAKMAASKPTNSMVIKSVTGIHTDGSIIPGKLADPEKMGGLNLLLMADKEMCTPLASSVPLSSIRTMAVSHPALAGHSSASVTDQSTVSASALLQLAEMCTSELQGCSENQHHPSSQSLPALPASIHLLGSTCASQQPMPPPKKRVRHWSLTETGSVYDASSDSSREYISGSLSPQNASAQKTRCTSLGSALSSTDRCSFMNIYKPCPSRRKLSSSATESIPSPTGPLEDGVDDTDSPVFSPDATRQEHLSGECRLDGHDHFDYLPQNLSRYANRSPTLVSRTSVHIPFDQNDQSVCQKVLKSMTPDPVTVSLQQPLNILTGTSGSVLPGDYPLPNTARHGTFLSVYSVPTSKTYGNAEGDAKSENDNESFTTWRELDKRRTKSEELLPEALNLHMSSGYTEGTCPPSGTLSHLKEKQVKYNTHHHDLTRSESKCDVKTHAATSALPVDLSFMSRACSVVKASSTSMISKGRIASILNNTSVSGEMFHLDASSYHSASETLSKITNEAKKCVKSCGDTSEPKSCQAGEQSTSLPMLASAGRNNSIINLQPGFKVHEAHGPNQPSNNPQAFREVKLKKKWTERMLIETKLKDLTQQTEGSGGHSLSNDAFNVNRSDIGTNAYQNVLHLESTPGPCVLKNFSNVITSGSSNKETTMLKMPTAYDIPSLQALLILNQPAGFSETVQNHTHAHAPFSPSSTSHTKLMLQLAQNQLTDRQDEAKSNNFRDESIIKSEPSVTAFTRVHQDYKCVNANQHLQVSNRIENDDGYSVNNRRSERDSTCDESIKNRKVDSASNDFQVKSEDLNKKEVMNHITACGKKFMDHIVEQLCKSDLSGSGCTVNTGVFDKHSMEGDGRSNSSHLYDVKPEVGREEAESFTRGLRDEPPVEWLKKDEGRDCSLHDEPCSVDRVENVASSSMMQTIEDGSARSISAGVNLPSQHEAAVSETEELLRKRETCGQAAVNLSADIRLQNHWSTAAPELLEQSDVNEDLSMQPVRKSRRANRGQKYQELIKEGFIQPSRERMAARNAERGGRSFGTREEFEKMEVKRTLKRSASEKDMPADSAVVLTSTAAAAAGCTAAVGCTASDNTMDKRFTPGDFDLEKEIESLPVCSLEPLDKKKPVKRRCDGDNLWLSLSHRNNGDSISTLFSKALTCTTNSKLGPFGGLVPKFDDLNEPCCLAPHIPLPKEDRPTEPVTGSRKRKARKHFIMRISVLDEKIPLAEVTVPKCAKALPSACPDKKLDCLSKDAQDDNVNVCSSVSSCAASESTGMMSSKPIALKAKTDGDDASANMVAGDCQSNRNDSAVSCAVRFSQTGTGKGMLASPASMLSLRSVSDSFASLPLSSSSSSPRSSVSKTLSESQPILAAASSQQKMSKLSFPLSASAQCIQTRIISSSVDTPTPNSSLATTEVASLVTSLTRAPALLKLTDGSVVPSQATCISSDGNCSVLSKTAMPATSHKQLGAHTGYNPVPWGKELSKTKSLERKSRKSSGGKMKSKPSHGDKFQADVKKAKSPLGRKYYQENESNVYVRSSSTPLVSALLGHIDLSYAIQFAERGESKIAALPQLWSHYETLEPQEESSSMNTPADTAPISSGGSPQRDLPTPVLSLDTSPLSTMKTHLIPFSVIEGHDKEYASGSVSKEIRQSMMASLNSLLKTAASPSSTLSSEELSSNERSSLATAKDASSLPHKPHPSIVAVTSTNDTTVVKPLPLVSAEAALVPGMGSSTSVLQHSPVCLVINSGSPTNHSVNVDRTSMSSTSSTLYSTLLSQMSSPPSSVSPATNSNNSPFVSTTVPLLPLPQPLSLLPVSSAALSSPAVLSSATSIPSTKNDIVSYAVIGSTSVTETGSPHMIGSPHLPESPSVAIVQS